MEPIILDGDAAPARQLIHAFSGFNEDDVIEVTFSVERVVEEAANADTNTYFLIQEDADREGN